MTWTTGLDAIASLGSTVPRPGSLAGLAQARQAHLGQFFTPPALVAFCWRLAQPFLQAFEEQHPGSRIDLFDSSVGSGRLWRHATPDRFRLHGIEIHRPCAEAVAAAAAAAGFDVQVHIGSYQDVRVRGRFNLALINPPFGLHLDSPLGERFPCGSFGHFGPRSSYVSHEFAVVQARKHADLAIAIVPRSFADRVVLEEQWRSGLLAVYHLPSSTFRSELTEVDTSVLVYGQAAQPCAADIVVVTALEQPVAPLPTLARATYSWSSPQIEECSCDWSEPVIRTPVTGDRRVRVTRNGRKLFLGFACGALEARVMNRILQSEVYRDRSRERRLPSSVAYRGQGAFDLENFLVQERPLAAWDAFLTDLIKAGAEPDPDPGIVGFLRRRADLDRRRREPFRHVVAKPGSEAPPSWTVVHAGLQTAFPDLWQHRLAEAKALGLHRWLTWRYQLEDLVELSLKRGASLSAWDMGLGKARLALALVMLGRGRRNLVVVEARLIDEMRTELSKLGVPRDDWQVIENAAQAVQLRRINLIAYSRLRTPLGHPWSPKRTLASLLRRRIHTLVADEGHCLRNLDTDQTRAVMQVSAKVRYLMSGTPLANYPRDILPLLQWVAGDGTAVQAYGDRHPFMRPENLHDLSRSRRGVDIFRDHFVTVQWITNVSYCPLIERYRPIWCGCVAVRRKKREARG